MFFEHFAPGSDRFHQADLGLLSNAGVSKAEYTSFANVQPPLLGLTEYTPAVEAGEARTAFHRNGPF
jgi:hypothetical protein